jgi:hypothetical protein
MKPVKIVTEDGVEVKVGDRVFNYYDGKWGVIEKVDTHPQPETRIGQNSSTPVEEWENYWFTLLHDDGTRASLDGMRIATYNPRRMP